MENINNIMNELAQYIRLADEMQLIIDGLKDEIKAYMINNNLDTINGYDHKATYKSIESSRIDTKSLKNELPELAARYTVTSNTMRFNFS